MKYPERPGLVIGTIEMLLLMTEIENGNVEN
jgi:hypothetical protein